MSNVIFLAVVPQKQIDFYLLMSDQRQNKNVERQIREAFSERFLTSLRNGFSFFFFFFLAQVKMPKVAKPIPPPPHPPPKKKKNLQPNLDKYKMCNIFNSYILNREKRSKKSFSLQIIFVEDTAHICNVSFVSSCSITVKKRFINKFPNS